MRIGVYLSLLICLVTGGCKEPYDPPFGKETTNVLIVEGSLNTIGLTKILLSRTVPLNEPYTSKPETKATVSIEADNNSLSVPLPESKTAPSGTYTSNTAGINPALKYRIRIRTSDGKEFSSAYVPVNNNPVIDSVGWHRLNGGVQLHVTTHDPANATRYYTWQTEETWEFRTKLFASLEVVPLTTPQGTQYALRDINSSQYPYSSRCWQSQRSNSILLSSSAKLSQDVISEFPVAFIPKDSWMLSEKYSILVTQNTLTKEAYGYLQNLKKNSEDLGGIFSPQPSEITGNISCTSDPEERVIGFFQAGQVREKRLFIDKTQVRDWFDTQLCDIVKIRANQDSIRQFFLGGGLFLNWTDGNRTAIFGTKGSCINCAINGSPAKPIFWP